MVEGAGSLLWLRVEDDDIDAAWLLRVTVSENVAGKGMKRKMPFVCKGICT